VECEVLHLLWPVLLTEPLNVTLVSRDSGDLRSDRRRGQETRAEQVAGSGDPRRTSGPARNRWETRAEQVCNFVSK